MNKLVAFSSAEVLPQSNVCWQVEPANIHDEGTAFAKQVLWDSWLS